GRARERAERIGPGFLQEGDHGLEQRGFLRRQVRHLDLGATRTTRGEQGELSFPVREDLVPPLPYLAQFVLEEERLRRIRILLRLRVGAFVEPSDVGGEFVVEVRFEIHESLLPALLPVDLGDALKIDVLLARHTARIRRPSSSRTGTSAVAVSRGSSGTASRRTACVSTRNFGPGSRGCAGKTSRTSNRSTPSSSG